MTAQVFSDKLLTVAGSLGLYPGQSNGIYGGSGMGQAFLPSYLVFLVSIISPLFQIHLCFILGMDNVPISGHSFIET